MFKHTHSDLIILTNDLANSVLRSDVRAHHAEWQDLHQKVGKLIDVMAFRRDLMLIVDDIVEGNKADNDTLDHLESIITKLKDTEEPVPAELAMDVQLLTGAVSYGLVAEAIRDMMPEWRMGGVEIGHH